MPYVRPATMRMSTNGVSSLLDESRFYSSADTSVTAEEGSTQNDEHTSSSPGLMNGTGSSSSSWQNNVSASFAQLAVQFQAASQNIATIQTAQASEPLLLAFTERLEAIEDEQHRLASAIEGLREQFTSISRRSPPESTVNDVEPAPIGPTVSDLEALLKAQQEAFKLDQEQLPAKLQNALAVKSLSPIRMPPMKTRKLPVNSPATRGEFEHLTRERYEAMLQAYGIPFSGDINAKREILRAFLGIPSLPVDKK